MKGIASKMEIQVYTSICLIAHHPFMLPLLLLLVLLLLMVLGWPKNSGKQRLPLPPGSMGWPYVGETNQLFSTNPNTFFTLKQKRYGSIFKTRILGCPCVMLSSPEAAKFVLATRSVLFKPTFPASKERMLGPLAIFFQQGEYHARLRRIVLQAFMPKSIVSMVAHIQSMAVSSLKSFEGREINTFHEMKNYAFNVALLSIFGKEEISKAEELQECYYTLERGYNAMAINLPGTLFHRAMKARAHLVGMITEIIASRRNMKMKEIEGRHNDVLSTFMEDKGALSDEQIIDNIIGLIFAARDTTASVLTWIIKYLGDNPAILEAVTKEQEEIKRSKETNALTWEDTRKMPMTSRVIQETMRVASILSFTFREAVEDVEYDGYLIPKGWKVLPLFRSIHHSPDNFTDPEKFDPSRFENAVKPNTFMPFGNGSHACPGNELAKLEMLVMLHHLTTQYKWSTSGVETGMQFGPFVLPINGLPLRFHKTKDL